MKGNERQMKGKSKKNERKRITVDNQKIKRPTDKSPPPFGRPWDAKSRVRPELLGSFWEPFPIKVEKMSSKKASKIRYRKVSRNDAKSIPK